MTFFALRLEAIFSNHMPCTLCHRPFLRALIAQLDRATDYESVGREFESLWAHHLLLSAMSHPEKPFRDASELALSKTLSLSRRELVEGNLSGRTIFNP